MIGRHLLNLTLTQERITARAPDGQGGHVPQYSVISTAFPGRISSGSAQERERGGRREAYYQSTLFAEPNADVQRDDRFTRSDGRQYKVVAVRDLGKQTHVEAAIELITPGS